MSRKTDRLLTQMLLSCAILVIANLAVIGQEEPRTPLLHYVAWNPLEDQLIASSTTIYGSIPLLSQDARNLPVMEEIYDVAYSPDGQRLAIANGSRLTILDAKTNSILSEIAAHATPIKMISWSPNGTQLATATDPSIGNQELKIWNVDPLESIFARDGGSIWQLAWSPSADQIAMTGVTSLGVYIMDVGKTVQSQNETEVRFIGRNLYASPYSGGVAWSNTGTIVAAAMDDGTIGLFDINSGEEVITLISGHTDSMTSLAFSPDGALLASASNDGTIHVHDIATHKLVAEYEKGKIVVPRRIAFSPFGGRLAFGSDVAPESLKPGELYVEMLDTMVVVPVVSIERLQVVAENCTNEQSAPALEQLNVRALTVEALPQFIADLKALPDGTLHPSCRGDLLAIAESITASP